MKIVVTPKPKDVGALNDLRIKAVINVNDSPDYLFNSPAPYYWFPIHECSWWGYAPFYGALKVCERYQNSGVIVIHCAAGVNRSPTIAYSMFKAFGYDDEAIKSYLHCVDGWGWAKGRLERNIEHGYVGKDILKFLKFAFENPNASLMDCLFKINSNNLTLSKESDILKPDNSWNFASEIV